MKIAVLGTGGIGGYFGGKIAYAGNDVTFLARGAHLKAIQQNGLIVKSVHGDFKVQPANATDTIKDIGIVDLAMVAVKAHQIKDMAKDLHYIVGKDTVVMPMENGIMAVDELREFVPASNVIGGLCRVMSYIKEPGVIEHQGAHKGESIIIFGETDGTKSGRVMRIKEMLDKADIACRISEDITADVWRKFMGICICGLLAVTRTTMGELREIKETRQLMIEVFTEIYKLSQKMGVKLESEIVEKSLSAIDSFPYDSSSSLSRDILAGKPSEIEYQNGSIVKLAAKYGVDVPVNRFVYSCILPMEAKARKW
ncbi:MAG: 2-dehydropantoate 2-reductase [Lentisphaerota bacterium]